MCIGGGSGWLVHGHQGIRRCWLDAVSDANSLTIRPNTQNCGLVPVVEPEILIDGNHSQVSGAALGVEGQIMGMACGADGGYRVGPGPA